MNTRNTRLLKLMGIDCWELRVPVVGESVVMNEERECVEGWAPEKWESLRQCVSKCEACELHKTRTQTVFGVGNPQAPILIVGEAPGEQEDKQGKPFVGRAGQLLDAMLKSIGLDRNKVYIANVLKCRPPRNRDPQASEIAQCSPFLSQQIAMMQPKIILALGRFAAHFLLNTKTSLTQLRGKMHTGPQGIPLLVSFHPAYLLRNPIDKKLSYQDLLFLQKQMADLYAPVQSA